MNCVIIEDELAGQEILKIKLARFFPFVNILKIISKKDEAITFLDEHSKQIDFIFIDIEIKGGTGLEVLDAIEKINFDVIFTTAYQDYALDAFKYNAVHYLLKPFSDADFKDAINRVQNRNNQHAALQEDFLYITNKNEIIKVFVNDIIYVKSDGSYSEIQLEDQKIVATKSIGEIEKSLDASTFFRVHHSYIVNKNKIEKIERARSGNVHLQGNHIIPISQRKMNDFLEFLGE